MGDLVQWEHHQNYGGIRGVVMSAKACTISETVQDRTRDGYDGLIGSHALSIGTKFNVLG